MKVVVSTSYWKTTGEQKDETDLAQISLSEFKPDVTSLVLKYIAESFWSQSTILGTIQRTESSLHSADLQNLRQLKV